MYNLTVQNEALTLAGYLSKVDIKNGWNLSKPDIESAIARSPTHIGEGFSDITTQGWEDFIGVITRGGLSFATSTRDEFSDSIKKGSTVNATLWDYSDGSDLDFLRWRRLISVSIEAAINCPVLSPSSFTNSIPWTISCGIRAAKVCDFALAAFVAITVTPVFRCSTVCTKKDESKCLTCSTLKNRLVFNTLIVSMCRNSEARKCVTTSRASNHNVNEAYTMALQHSTQTRPKFQYLFLAVHRSDLNAKPHRESVTAHSEQDARRSLAGQFVLSFAGRIPNRRVVA